MRPIATRDLFVTARLKPTLERCVALARSGTGLLTITGEPGTGKTTLLRWLFDTLPTETHEVLLTGMIQRERHAGWLLPRLAELLGVADDGSPHRQIQHIAARLDDFATAKRHLVLIIDAAHLAESAAALEDVTALLNLHALGGNGLTVVVAGTEAILDNVLKTPELAAKTTMSLKLTAFNREETGAYIQHRLKVAGVNATFSPEALDAAHVRSRGVPATLNHLCENVLFEAFQRQATTISGELVLAAGAHLGRQGPPPPAMSSEAGDGQDLPQTLAMSMPVAAGEPELPPLPGPAMRPREVPRKNAAERQESASIKLSSLFKSDPGRSQS